MTGRPGRRLRLTIHAASIAGLLLVAFTGLVARRTAHAFPVYAERVARAYQGQGTAAGSNALTSEQRARIDAAVRRVDRYVTASVILSLALLATSHVLLTREINRREEIERALNDANRELESFSYSVSHDLRAPLRSIDGFSQALVEDAGPTLAPDARAHLDRIRSATQRMGLLIDDLIALSRVSRATMKVERVDLSEVSVQIVAELMRQAPTRTVDVTIAPGLTAQGDAQLVRLVLQNLIENAWKFTGRRAHASIEIGQTRDNAGAVAIFVRDNGAGFDPAFAQNLFGPFQRLHPASDFPGTGIGLATVKRIVHRHGGHVWADGQVDQGATFAFTLG